MAQTFAQKLVGSMRDVLQEILTLLGDPDARAKGGLNPTANVDPTATQARLDSASAYFESDNPDGSKYLQAVDDVLAAIDGIHDLITTIIDDPGAVTDYVDFLIEVTGLNYLRRNFPYAYYIGRTLGFIEDQGTIQSVHRLHLGNIELLFRSPSVVDYFGQALSDPSDQTRADLALGGAGAAVLGLFKLRPLKRNVKMKALYGWDSLPDTATRVDTLLERALTLSFENGPGSDCSTDSTFKATCDDNKNALALLLNLVYVADADELDSHSKGVLVTLALQETFTFDISFGNPPKVKGRLTFQVDAPFDLTFFVGDTVESLSTVQPPAMKLTYAPQPDTDGPSILIGSKDGTRLEIGKFKIEASLEPLTSSANYGFRIGVEDAAVVIKPGDGDGFLQTILGALATGGEIRVSFELALGAQKNKGFFIEGGTGLRITLAVGKQLGPVRIETLVLGIDAKTDEQSGKFKVDALVAAGLTFKTTGVSITVDQMGLGWSLKPLGSLGFRPPKGLGISIDLGPVSGGGYLFFDADNHQYAGAVHLAFGNLAINGVGLVQTYTKPDGSQGYAFVIILSVTYKGGFQIGFGFTINGIGGLFGQNRGVSTDALQQGIKTGALDTILFPENPVANAPRIISVLSSVFPVSDGQTIFGPMLQVGWAPQPLISLSLGLIIEFAPPHRYVLLGKAVADFPDKDHSKLHLELDCVGIFNPSTGESSFDASLYRSTVGPYTLMGDIVWRSAGGGRPFWILALGGTNPHFDVPKGLLPPMNKIGINLVTGDNPRAWLAGYTAITSNTFQVGGAIDASYSKAGFTLSAHIGADVLINTKSFTFIIDFSMSVSLKRGSSSIASIGLSGTVTGPKPLHFDGSASISFFFFSVSFHVQFTIGSEDPAPLPSFSVTGSLTEALQDPHNWSGALPESESMMLTLTKATSPDPNADPSLDVMVHPLGQLVVRQRVAPIGLEMQKFGTGAISGDSKFTLDNASLGAGTTTSTKEAVDFFAAGDYVELTDDQKLSRPAFENMQSGLIFGADDTRTGEALPTKLQYKTLVRRKGAAAQALPAFYIPSVGKFLAAVNQGAAARSLLRASGLGKFAGPTGQVLGISDPRYTVVSSTDLRQAAGLPANVQAGATYAQAAQALRTIAAGGAAGGLHVVALHEVQA